MRIDYNLFTVFWIHPNSNATKIRPPTTIDQNGHCWWASSHLSIRYSNVTSTPITEISFKQISFNMKIAKKKVIFRNSLVNLIIDLERPLEKILENGKDIIIKFQNTPGCYDSRSYEINFPYYKGGSHEESFVWRTNFSGP